MSANDPAPGQASVPQSAPAPPARRNVWPWLVPLLVLLPLLAYAGWWGYQAIERRSALELARTGPFSAAAPLLEAQLARRPADVELLQALCRGYAEEADGTPAGPLLDRWCQLAPDSAEPFRLRMNFHRKESRFSLALQDGLRLLRFEPDNADLALSVAGLAFSAGETAEAEKRCREVLARQPKRRDGRRLLAE